MLKIFVFIFSTVAIALASCNDGGTASDHAADSSHIPTSDPSALPPAPTDTVPYPKADTTKKVDSAVSKPNTGVPYGKKLKPIKGPK